jgi:hypothetical protein
MASAMPRRSFIFVIPRALQRTGNLLSRLFPQPLQPCRYARYFGCSCRLQSARHLEFIVEPMSAHNTRTPESSGGLHCDLLPLAPLSRSTGRHAPDFRSPRSSQRHWSRRPATLLVRPVHVSLLLARGVGAVHSTVRRVLDARANPARLRDKSSVTPTHHE